MEKVKYYIILHIVFAVYSFMGIASKLASGEPFLSFKFIMYYGMVILTLFLYALVWQQLLKKLPLVTAYANKAVTVIWGIIWGFVFFHEEITISKLLGALIIVIGVWFVVTADEENNEEDNKKEYQEEN